MTAVGITNSLAALRERLAAFNKGIIPENAVEAIGASIEDLRILTTQIGSQDRDLTPAELSRIGSAVSELLNFIERDIRKVGILESPLQVPPDLLSLFPLEGSRVPPIEPKKLPEKFDTMALAAARLQIRQAKARLPERCEVFRDKSTGALAVLVVDDSSLGTTTGGAQLRGDFHEAEGGGQDWEDRLIDKVKGFARCGTWKCALGTLPLGGGKLVISAPPALLSAALTVPDARREVKELVKRVGERFQDCNYHARPDMGMSNELFDAYAEGGGKINQSYPFENAAERTALSVVGGITAALRYRSGATLNGSSILVEGAGGRIGQQIVRILVESGAAVTISNRDPITPQLVESYGVATLSPEDLLERRADALCWAGPPATVGIHQLTKIRAPIVTGCANDLLVHPEFYRLRGDLLIIPAAVVTSASMVVPTIKALERPDLRPESGNITNRVLAEYDEWHGMLTPFEAMILSAEKARLRSRSHLADGPHFFAGK